MKQRLFYMMIALALLFQHNANAQDTFTWDSVTPTNGEVSVSETVSGVTATVTNSLGAVKCGNFGGFGGSSGNLLWAYGSMTVNFSSAVNITSMNVFNADGNSNGVVMITPIGGSNSNVVYAEDGAIGRIVTVNWVGVTSFTITNIDGYPMGLDTILLNGLEVPCTNPTAAVLSATNTTICSGGSTTLNISGDLNDATQWAIYTGSCGGTLIGTTTTSSINVNPSSTTTYYVRGEGGCVTSGVCATITINVSSLVVTPSSQTNIACNGGANGKAAVNAATGGTAPYTYDWTGTPVGDGTTSITGLTAGNYSCQVTDANGCQVTSMTFTITQPPVLSVTATIDSEITTMGGNDGAITASATGGTASFGATPYMYNWSNGATTASITGLSAGTYTCYVTDANGCTTSVEQILAYISPAPVAYEVTGGGQACPNAGVAIGLANSEEGVSYQLQINGWVAADAVAGTGAALSFGDFSEVGTYTVVATNTENELATTMSGNAVVTAASYIMIIEEPQIDCSTTSVYLNAITGNLTDFEGVFAPENWTLTNASTDGSINTLDTPDYITLIGGNNGLPQGGTTDYSITVPASGLLSFSWDYSTNDGAFYDYPQIVYNGVATTLNGYDTNGPPEQFGTVTMQVEEGATLTLRMKTVDNVGGAASVTISDWSLASSVTGTPAFSWTASNGGVIDGDTDSLEIEATSSGTYTLTASVDGCMFSKDIVLDFESFELDVTTWNGEAWSNGEPQEGMKAIIDGDLVIDSFFVVCELEVTENGSLTVQPSGFVGVIGKITNNATATDFVVENAASLAQLKDVQNVGPVTVNVTSFPLYRQDYTLWSSPVKEQNLRSFSPQTLFNRFSSYNPSLGTVGEYVQEIVTSQDVLTKEFAPANGYLIRTPNNWAEYVDDATPGVAYEGVFTGVPQNGTISVPLATVNGGFNLVGNPYPSPLAIGSLFDETIGMDQTVYFWRKRNAAAGSGYATYNNLGFSSAQPELNDFGTDFENNPVISPGQGFFIKSTGATTFNFTNQMRVPFSNGLFLKTASVEKHRMWLNLKNSTGIVGQTLIGYVSGATSGVDNGFDSTSFNDSSFGLTSLINGVEYAIQGLALPFDTASSVALGFKTDAAGTYSISLSNFDGLFIENQDIYIKDNVTGMIHNVKESAYSFTANEGIANDRFEVVYTNSVLGTANPELLVKNILVAVKGQSIAINAGTVVMDSIELIDLAGRVIYTQNDINTTTATIENVLTSNQMLVVRITTAENEIVNKKIIF